MKKNIFIWLCALTALAGLINTISIRLFAITVSHMTGLISNAVLSTIDGNFSHAGWLLSVIGAYLIGAVLSAYITGDRNFFVKPVYGYIVTAIGVFLFAGIHLLSHDGKMIIKLFAFLMGAQNGMIVSFKGVLVRMTHMTGYITDVGVYMGYKLRGKHKEDYWTGLVPLCGIVMFITGGIFGLWLFARIDYATYDIASALYVSLGLIYLIIEKHSDDRDLDGVVDDLLII